MNIHKLKDSEIKNMVKKKFVLEGNEEIFEGFYFPHEFFGAWEEPLFDHATMERIATIVNETKSEIELRFDPVGNVWIEIMGGVEWTYFSKVEMDGEIFHQIEGWCFVVANWK